MNRFFSHKVAYQLAQGLSKRTYSTLRSTSINTTKTSIYLGGGIALVSAFAWKSIGTIDNEIDEKKIQEGKSIAKETGSGKKENEAKKEAVGRGNVQTKVPAEEGAPKTKSEVMANEEAEQTKSNKTENRETPQKGSDNSEIKWGNQFLKPISSGPCGREFKDAFSLVLSSLDLKGADTIKKLEALRRCLNDHPDITKE